MFNVDPTASQVLIDDVKLTDEFLERINVITVDNQMGEAIGLGVGCMIASRTNTLKGGERKTRSVHDMSAMPYFCSQTNFDTNLTYNQLSSFAHLKDFEERVNGQIRAQADLDKIRVAFYGKSAEDDTDVEANPNGEDVNKGWIQALREHQPERVLTVKTMLDERFAATNDLVAIIGNELIATDQAKLYAENGSTPSEKSKIEMRQVISTYGGLPSFLVSNSPPRGIMVTSFDNLSIYIQGNTIRKSVGKRNDSKNRVESFESMNMAYVVEQLGKAATVEFDNVKLKKLGTDVWQ